MNFVYIQFLFDIILTHLQQQKKNNNTDFLILFK